MNGGLERFLLQTVPKMRWYPFKRERITKVSVEGQVRIDGERSVVCCRYFFNSGRSELLMIPVVEMHGEALDGTQDEVVQDHLLQMIDMASGEGVVFQGRRFSGAPRRYGERRIFQGEQSNTSILFGREVMLKVIRRFTPGPNPDWEMPLMLRKGGFRRVPEPIGIVEAVMGSERGTFLSASGFVENDGDGWSRFTSTLTGSGSGLKADVTDLGENLARMHNILLESGSEVASRQRIETLRASVMRNLSALRERVQEGRPSEVLGSLSLVNTIDGSLASVLGTRFCRIHGDLHLGQVLHSPDGYYFIDFEGEPARPLEERIAMNSPLKDLAGLVRSLHYAATFAWKVGGADRDSMEAWYGEHSDLLIRKYMDRSELVDEMGEQRATAALRFYTIEKALYEVSYEMNNRPDWVQIPLEYIGGLIA